MSDLPVVVIGAGPSGLAAAAHLLERGMEPLVLESGLVPASAVGEWGHVRLFSAWPELVDKASARLLAPTGWTAPEAGYPTGAQWIDGYLAPLVSAATRNCPETATKLPGGGHENCPLTVTGSARHDVVCLTGSHG